jgi:hypothetical protein
VIMDVEQWSAETRELAASMAKGDLPSSLTSNLVLSTAPRKGDIASSLRPGAKGDITSRKGRHSVAKRVTLRRYAQDATKSLIYVRDVRSVRARADARIGPIASGEQTGGERSETTERSGEILKRLGWCDEGRSKLGDGAGAGGVRSHPAVDETALRLARQKAAERRWGARDAHS